MRVVYLSIAVALFASCNTSRTKDAEMSVQEHRRAAEVHEAEAEEHAQKFDPDAVSQRPPVVTSATPEAGLYNPTLREKLAAERHEEKAEEHLRAAAELAAAEERECLGVEPTKKVGCPVIGPLASVERVKDGVRFTLLDPARHEDVLQHLRCHVAFSNARGIHDEEACALDTVGLSIKDDGDGIIIETKKRSDANDILALLQAQVRRR